MKIKPLLLPIFSPIRSKLTEIKKEYSKPSKRFAGMVTPWEKGQMCKIESLVNGQWEDTTPQEWKFKLTV